MALLAQCQTAGWRAPGSCKTPMTVTVAAGAEFGACRDSVAEGVDGVCPQPVKLKVNVTVGVVGRCRCTAVLVTDMAVECDLRILVVGVRTGLVRLGMAAAARRRTAPDYRFVVACGRIK